MRFLSKNNPEYIKVMERLEPLMQVFRGNLTEDTSLCTLRGFLREFVRDQRYHTKMYQDYQDRYEFKDDVAASFELAIEQAKRRIGYLSLLIASYDTEHRCYFCSAWEESRLYGYRIEGMEVHVCSTCYDARRSDHLWPFGRKRLARKSLDRKAGQDPRDVGPDTYGRKWQFENGTVQGQMEFA